MDSGPSVAPEGSEPAARPDDYVVVDGLRLVKPYHYDFKCHVKRRWIGRTVVDVFSKEFPARDKDYYEEALRDGRLRVEDLRKGKIWKGGVLEEGQCIRHLIHRHEPPVLSEPVEVVGITPEVMAVSKPPGVPVHVSGQYRKNTVIGILQAHSPDVGELFPVHRLDKLVSGLLLFARNAAAANTLRENMMDKVMEKLYIARVAGAFSKDSVTVSKSLTWDPKANRAAIEGGDGAPGTSGRAAGQREAKLAVTDFRLRFVAPDGRTSVVECRPRTGRTHQIRVHLQHLGHPIANDTQYGGSLSPERPTAMEWRRLRPADAGPTRTWESSHQANSDSASVAAQHAEQEGEDAPMRAKRRKIDGVRESGSPAERTQQQPIRSSPADVTTSPHAGASRIAGRDSPDGSPKALLPEAGAIHYPATSHCAIERPTSDTTDYLHPSAAVHSLPCGGGCGAGPSVRDVCVDDHLSRYPYLVDSERRDALCMHCPAMVPRGYPVDLEPLWLHAVRYSGPAFSFDCPEPVWAQREWTPAGGLPLESKGKDGTGCAFP
eukprot:evm.model.scf_1301EXC.2 EVM.evm.TU.scf_1301EXC.2   scf_1301EXC:10784-21491(+)